jgi:hypothetical protein
MRNLVTVILITCASTIYSQRYGSSLPVHSIHTGFFTNTAGGHNGLFFDYQYYMDDVISYSVKPGATGIFQNKDTTSYFLYAGINYRFNALRKPLREKPFNSQPYAGFYPLTFEYCKMKPRIDGDPDTRLGIVPSGIIGYTLIFFNRFDLDMHAGFGISFRLSGGAGDAVQPSAFAGIGLGVRL